MRRRLVTMVTLAPLSCGPFSSQRDPLRYASAPLHGDFPYSVEERQSISRNRRVLAEIAAALSGERRWPDYFSVSRGLWWLAESGRREYLPLFLRYSDPTGVRWPPGARRNCLGCHPGDVMTFSAYGLVRQAARPEAARRLRELLAVHAHSVSYNVVSMLVCVNDSATRALLRELIAEPLPERVASMPLWKEAVRRTDSALAAPPRPLGQGRCPPLPQPNEGSSAGVPYTSVPRLTLS
jgi:hypothetical protein